MDYLSERPFKEVFQLVAGLQQEAANQPVVDAEVVDQPEYDVTLDDDE
jgi:hypothetical protein